MVTSTKFVSRAFVVALVIGACSSGDGTATTTEPSTPTAATAPTDQPSTAATVPPTSPPTGPVTEPTTASGSAPEPVTTEPVTTEPVTTEPVATAPPVTVSSATTAPAADLTLAEAEQQVIAASHANWAATVAALRDPSSDELLDALPRHLGGEWLERIAISVLDRRNQGRRATESNVFPATYEVYVDRVTVDLDAGSATVEVCFINSDVVIDTTTGAVINDDIAADHDLDTLSLVDNRWVTIRREQLSRTMGATTCPDP